ncbi:sterol o-acyltransferase [Anaeramoeba flamelloides]|uniref:O-acyltransferase n=1 Tax=Anaeramoeba flamelloides TaxID=1746091 RepID=A0AAV7Y6R7_9EUKA|nr:sterol o-acyltransferase [Anaeramoeba flamelloides]
MSYRGSQTQIQAPKEKQRLTQIKLKTRQIDNKKKIKRQDRIKQDKENPNLFSKLVKFHKSITGLYPLLLFGFLQILVNTYFNFSCNVKMSWSITVYVGVVMGLPTVLPMIILVFMFSSMSYLIKKMFYKKKINMNVARILNLVVVGLVLAVPLVFYLVKTNIWLRSILGTLSVCHALKLYSYFECLFRELGNEKSKKVKSKIINQHQQRESYRKFLLFLNYPTLIYRTKYDFVDKVDYKKAFRYFVGLVLSNYLLVVNVNSFMKNMGEPINNLVDFSKNLSCLGFPTFMFFVLMWIQMYHFFLNFSAELTRFKRRQFYGNWTADSTCKEFWKSWNRPVYNYSVRHIYVPTITKLKLPKLVAGVLVFTFSGLFHCYIMWSVFGFWSFSILVFFAIQPFFFLIDNMFENGKNHLWAVIFKILIGFVIEPIFGMICFANNTMKFESPALPF